MGETRPLSDQYTPTALQELDEILSYISLHSPAGAYRVQSRIKSVIALLSRHPQAGQVTTLIPVRRIVVMPFPYVVLYSFTETDLNIISVRHASRRPSEEMTDT